MARLHLLLSHAKLSRQALSPTMWKYSMDAWLPNMIETVVGAILILSRLLGFWILICSNFKLAYSFETDFILSGVTIWLNFHKRASYNSPSITYLGSDMHLVR